MYETDCPPSDLLRAHLRGETSGDVVAALDEHFSSCDRCLAIAAGFRHDASDSCFIGAKRYDGNAQEPERELIERWTAHPPEIASNTRSVESLPKIAGYRVIERVGSGGTGAVFKAEDEKLKRVVAIKWLPALLFADRKSEAHRFHLEAEAIARLQHPNIVQIYDVGNEQPYLALEFVDGPTLQMLLSEKKLSHREAADLAERITGAMEYAHSMGVIHRDLKPANVLIAGAAIRSPNAERGDSTIGNATTGQAGSKHAATESDLRPKITDFGLAKLLDSNASHTCTGTVMGTASYMSPEQASGRIRDTDERTDIYSIGATLYEMLVGQPPFSGESPAATIQLVLAQEPTPIRQMNASVPRDLETICMKCLEKDRSKRYASASALGDDLRRFLDGRSISARPVTKAERVWRWCLHNPIVAALTAACVALSVTGAAQFLMLKAVQANQARPTLDGHANPRTELLPVETDESTSPDRLVARWLQELGVPFELSNIDGSVLSTSRVPRDNELLADARVSAIDFAHHKYIDDKSMERLRDLKFLRSLDLTATSIGSAGFAILSEIRSLEELKLIRLENFTAEDAKSLRQLPNLKSVDLFCTPIDDECLANLAEAENFESLTFDGEHVSEAAIIQLQKLVNLWQLDINPAPGCGRASLESFVQLPSLTCLRLYECPEIDDDCLDVLARFTHLEELFLCGSSVTEQGIATMPVLTNLDSLWIRGPCNTTTALPGLIRQPSLQKLFLTGAINSEFVKGLSKLPNLVTLEITATELTPEVVRALATLTHLSTLRYEAGVITPNLLQQLKIALPACNVQQI